MIEKILAVDEALDETLPVAGTTGYDALREIGGVFVDPAGEEALTALVDSAGADYRSTPALARRLKEDAVTHTLASELGRLCRVVSGVTGDDHRLLPDAVAAVVSRIWVYRSDYQGLWPMHPGRARRGRGRAPELAEPLQILAAAMTRGGEAGGAVAATLWCGDREVDGGLPVLP